MLNDFNEIISKIISSSSSPNIKFGMQPPPGSQGSQLLLPPGAQGSQLLLPPGSQGSQLLLPPGSQETQYLIQPLGQPGQLGVAGQVGNINVHQKQIISNLTSLASNYFPSILEGLKKSNAELDKQSDDFKKLNNKLRDMNKIQSSISLITAKIKLPESEKVTSYIVKVPVESKPSLSLKDIVSNPLNQKMKESLESMVKKLKPEDFSNLKQNLGQGSQSQQFGSPLQQFGSPLQQFGSPLQQFSSPFMQPIQQQTDGLFPQQLQPQQLQQQQSLSGISNYIYGIPGVSGLIPAQYLPQDDKKLDASKPEDQIVLNNEKDIRKLLESGVEKDFNEYLNKNINSFARHPYAYVYLATPKGLNWLTETDNGKKFLASSNYSRILDNIKNLVKDPRISGSQGNYLAGKLSDLSIAAAEESIKTKLTGEIGTGMFAKQMQEYAAAAATAKQ